MGSLRPDFKVKNTLDGLYLHLRDETIRPENYIEPEPLPVEELRKYIDAFAIGYKGDDKNMYLYSRETAKLAVDRHDSIHYFDLFITFFIKSLRETFPDKTDFLDGLEKNLIETKKQFADTIKDGNIQNTYYITALVGMLRGLI